MQKLMNTEELAEKLNVPKSWIYERSRKKEIPGMVKLGRYCLFDPDEIDSWLTELKEQGGRSSERDNTFESN